MSVTPIHVMDSFVKTVLIDILLLVLYICVTLLMSKIFSKYIEILFLREPAQEDLEVVIEAVKRIDENIRNPEEFMKQYKK